MLTSQTGEVTSPNHPNNYPGSVECVWDIVVQDGYHVVLTFEGIFDVEAGAGGTTQCYYDYVRLTSVLADDTEV